MISDKNLGIIFVVIPLVSLLILCIHSSEWRRLLLILGLVVGLFIMFLIGLDLLGV